MRKGTNSPNFGAHSELILVYKSLSIIKWHVCKGTDLAHPKTIDDRR